MASIASEQQGLWRYITSVSIGTTGATPSGDSLDMRGFSQGVIYATSTHGTPTLTYWTAPSSSGTYRLLKTSTGGAVTTLIAANAAIRMPASVAGGQFVRLSGSTTAAYKTLPAVMLKK